MRSRLFGRSTFCLLPSFGVMISPEMARLQLTLQTTGLSFAYQVGLLITAHVSKGPFPYFHVLLLWSAFGSLDANLPRLFGRPPILQSSDEKAVMFVIWSAVFAFAVYAWFVYDTIDTFCEVLDINCLSIKWASIPIFRWQIG